MHILLLHLYSWMFSTRKKHQGSHCTTLLHTLFVQVKGKGHSMTFLFSKGGGGGIAPPIRNPALGGGLSAPRSGLFIPGRYPLQRKVGGPRVWCGRYGNSYRNWIPGPPSPLRVAIPTTLPQTPNCSCTNTISCSTLEDRLKIKVMFLH
jgi:hypothetical protein